MLFIYNSTCLISFSTCFHLPENDCCDRSELLECRRNKSLLLLRDRTESERDELRAACRRRREEAAVRDNASLGTGASGTHENIQQLNRGLKLWVEIGDHERKETDAYGCVFVRPTT